MSGNVFSIERFSSHDGPGIRTVVFLKGCPLSCVWCHNPEGISPKPELSYTPERCISCRKCASVCENGCHSFSPNGEHRFDRSRCISCGKCADACVSDALTVTGKTMTFDEVIGKVLADRAFYGENGGMTLSGGEPLAQPEFALALLRAARENGIKTAVETSGYCPPEVIRAASEYTDLFLFDIKATGRELHRRLTGVYPDVILSNLELLSSIGANTVLRCPIIPTQNDSEEHFSHIAALAERYETVSRVDIERYNPMASSKCRAYGYAEQERFPTLTDEETDRIISYISARTSKKVSVP